ncbi:MAG: SDR family oxidoreductase [Sphingomonadaceae bacterium]|nr:SDR family oxidoreductase [Sphingomonadaceae bacterium]
MEKSLAGKIALITGAGQGVGRGIALAMARAGASIILFGRTQSKLDAVAGEIAAFGGDTLVIAGDVGDAASLDTLVAAACTRFGGIDILVNNAQQVPNGKLADVSDEAFLAGFMSGPMAAFRLMKLTAPVMAARGGGVVFNLTSSATIRWDMTGYGAYAAVKQAMRSLTRAAAAEWGASGIRVLSIAPHALSEGMRGWMERNPEEAAEFLRVIPLGRVGDCEGDIGAALVALCAPGLAYLTGATIPLDGGQANFD